MLQVRRTARSESVVGSGGIEGWFEVDAEGARAEGARESAAGEGEGEDAGRASDVR